MLTHLKLRDLVIVDEAELEFGPGLTALTGETGAGKSIVVDALLLIAGGRGAGDIVRQGAERAEVAAGFSSLSADALRWLEEQSIEHDGELILRRVLGADGRSRAYVNGQLVPLAVAARTRRSAHRDSRPAGAPAPGEAQRAARAPRRAARAGKHCRRGRSVRSLPHLPRGIRIAAGGCREPRVAARAAALPARRAQGRGHHPRRHRGAVRGTEAHRRPRAARASGERRAQRGVRRGERERARSARQGLGGAARCGGDGPEARAPRRSCSARL